MKEEQDREAESYKKMMKIMIWGQLIMARLSHFPSLTD